jgi:hypothetical protein
LGALGGLRLAITSVLLAVLLAFHVVTLRSGYGWGDDFAMYIHHAKNIAEGLPYAATGYVYNPHNPGIGPAVYPPGYPLLLAPVYKVFGIDVQAMRLELIGILIADLGLLSALFGNDLPPTSLAALMAIIGLNPLVWSLREEILSDIPFLFFCLLALLILRRMERAIRPAQPWMAAGLGAVCYLAFATRTIGVLLVVCAISSDLTAHRRFTRLSAIVVGVFAALAVMQRIAFGPIDSYVDQLVLNPGGLLAVIVLNVKNYALTLISLWGTDSRNPIATVLTAASLALAAVGFWHQARRAGGVLITFPVLYVAVLLVWPNFQGVRFLLPVVPFYVYFAIRGFRALLAARSGTLQLAGALATVAAIAVAYTSFYANAYYGPIGDGVFSPTSTDLFQFVRGRTSPSDVLIFFKPRALALFTDRSASAYYWPDTEAELLGYFRDIDATLVVVGPQDTTWANSYIAPDSTHFVPLWSNADFTVYQTRLEL